MTPNDLERVSRTLKALRTSLLTVLEHVDELSRLADELAVASPEPASPDDPTDLICRVDRRTLTVYWKDRSCFLGYTLPFRLMERLAQRPNQYTKAERLMLDLWGGPKAPSTIRSAISDLRIKLTAAGMGELAAMIDGRNPGHYGLISGRSPSDADALPTAVRRQSDSRGRRRW